MIGFRALKSGNLNGFRATGISLNGLRIYWFVQLTSVL